MSIVEGFLLTSLIILISALCFKLFFVMKAEREYFIKTLSHDLRVSAIAQIRGLEVLQKNIYPNSFEAELISDINDSCKFSLDMISTLLNTYKIENGEDVLNYSAIDIQKIINDSINQNSVLLKDKNIKVVFKPNKSDCIEADIEALTKVFQILLSIVVAYAKNNTKVNIVTTTNRKELFFQIFYKGKPLTEEECRRMFCKTPKYSTVGQGIRLHLCKKIIDFHKGKINVVNHSNQINSFEIVLPIKQNSELLKLDKIKFFSVL